MDEQNGDLNDLAKADGAVGSLRLNDGRTRGVMVIWLSHAFLFKFFGHPFYDLSVLCVNHSGKIVFSGRKHDVQQFAVS